MLNIESFRLEKTFEIIESNHKPDTAKSTKRSDVVTNHTASVLGTKASSVRQGITSFSQCINTWNK